MAINTTLSGLSQSAASNGPDGGSDAPSTLDDAIRNALAFIATLRDGKGHSAEVDLASGATCDIGGQNSLFVRITGTTTITSFGTNYNGPRFLRFAGALTLTHNASTLILPGGASITTAAGDTCLAVPISGGWVVTQYTKAAGTATVGALTSGTAQAATSGTAKDFTGIPSWAKRITINFSGLSTNGTSNPLIQLGDSGGIEASGYSSVGTVLPNGGSTAGTSYTSGFGIASNLAANVLYGRVTLELLDASTNTWTCAGVIANPSGPSTTVVSGSKALSAMLDRLRLTTVNGTDQFDAGTVNIQYE